MLIKDKNSSICTCSQQPATQPRGGVEKWTLLSVTKAVKQNRVWIGRYEALWISNPDRIYDKSSCSFKLCVYLFQDYSSLEHDVNSPWTYVDIYFICECTIFVFRFDFRFLFLRNLSLGVGSMLSRVGGILAPYVVFLVSIIFVQIIFFGSVCDDWTITCTTGLYETWTPFSSPKVFAKHLTIELEAKLLDHADIWQYMVESIYYCTYYFLYGTTDIIGFIFFCFFASNRHWLLDLVSRVYCNLSKIFCFYIMQWL
jgi:hypothetical protein